MPHSHLLLKQDALFNLCNLCHSLFFKQLLDLAFLYLLPNEALVLFACVFYHFIGNCVHVHLFNLARLGFPPNHGQLASIDVRI